jgi:hypothetical protein
VPRSISTAPAWPAAVTFARAAAIIAGAGSQAIT